MKLRADYNCRTSADRQCIELMCKETGPIPWTTPGWCRRPDHQSTSNCRLDREANGRVPGPLTVPLRHAAADEGVGPELVERVEVRRDRRPAL